MAKGTALVARANRLAARLNAVDGMGSRVRFTYPPKLIAAAGQDAELAELESRLAGVEQEQRSGVTGAVSYRLRGGKDTRCLSIDFDLDAVTEGDSTLCTVDELVERWPAILAGPMSRNAE